MATPRNIVGPRLRALRIERGLSQQKLAEALQRRGWDVSRGIIARIEGQVRWVADFELLFLADSMRVPVQMLLSGKGASRMAGRLVRELQHGVE
jgi:transcriptional regulator with XRE-family HTH domain